MAETTDNKRFSIIPLSYNEETRNHDRALPGEIVVDDETGSVYVRRRRDNELVSATDKIAETIKDVLDGALGDINYAYNNNRVVYRFYFDGNTVKLDSSLNLPAEYVYYQIRDINRATKYYLTDFTKVENTGVSIYPEGNSELLTDSLRHNGTYFVEFYNINFELMTQLLFTAKKAPALQTFGLDKFVDHITISTNRDILYINEPLESINVRVYAVFGDGSVKDSTTFSNVSLKAVEGSDIVDITDKTMTFISLDDIDTKTPGDYTIVATFINTADGYTEYTATKVIRVSETEYSQLLTNGLVVVPKLYSEIDNDIRLRAYGYFQDGSMRDITDRVVFSYSGKLEFDTNGKLDKEILVKFNVGEGNSVQQSRNVRVTLYTNTSSSLGSDAIVQFDDSIDDMGIGRKVLRIHPDHRVSEDYTYYRVRCTDVLDDSGYYTPSFGTRDFPVMYSDFGLEGIVDGTQVIVEYYNVHQGLVCAETLTCRPVVGLE